VPCKEILVLLDSSLSFCLNSSSESFRVVFPDFGIFFKCVLDISLSLCRHIEVPLSCVSPTSLALVFYIFMSLVEHRRWISWVVFDVEQLWDRASAIWLSFRP
jgi:hypothetical protein